ncbi:MAG: septation protein A [Gammaproteobacteria bacterium]|nr:septation protein A [Gammaproteobacteria bacterium]
MKLLIDFFPVFAFFVAYKAFDIYVATAVLIVSFLAQFLLDWHKNKKINKMHLTSLVLVLVFGGITLFLRNEIFIQWKPTVLNWLFALAFLVAPLITKKTLVQRLLEKNIDLAPHLWRQLNFMWIVFFTLSGAANLYVVYHYDEATWVNFKLFGLLGLTFLFVLLQGIWLSKKAELVASSTEQPTSQVEASEKSDRGLN